MKARAIFLFVVFTISFLPITGSQAQTILPVLTLLNSWGGEGNAFNEPTDVAVTPEGDILIVNRGLSRVTRISTSEEAYSTIGYSGYGEGGLSTPNGISIAPDGSFYVSGSNAINHFSSDGNFLDVFFDWESNCVKNQVNIRSYATPFCHESSCLGWSVTSWNMPSSPI